MECCIQGDIDSNVAIAHYRERDGAIQTVLDHNEQVSRLTASFAQKLGLSYAGDLIGLVHDVGKNSFDFQQYIRSRIGVFTPNDEQFCEEHHKVDHATAGGQWIMQSLQKYGRVGRFIGHMLSLCVFSHHGGLLDNLDPQGTPGIEQYGYSPFLKRIETRDKRSHFSEVAHHFPNIDWHALVNEAKNVLRTWTQNQPSPIAQHFAVSLGTRFLFSCLIDADRLDTARFVQQWRPQALHSLPSWERPIAYLENKFTTFKSSHPSPVIRVRERIADECKVRSTDDRGIYTMTVPTGCGKTLSSMRWAMHHAQHHELERIIVVLPYTSIIEQNAAVIRDLFPQDEQHWVLEHHSNVSHPQPWSHGVWAENWDAPILFITMVQFLDALFAGGTRDVRRLHRIANAVIVFDEIQRLPLQCSYLFCQAINFCVDHAGSSVLMCTATQPCLDALPDAAKGSLNIKGEIVSHCDQVFKELQRVTVVNKMLPSGWEKNDIVQFILDQYYTKQECLVIVNTRAWAHDLYAHVVAHLGSDHVFYMSTHMCPLHRKNTLRKIRERLDQGVPTLVISTQLIEAGVDISFSCVIRFAANLDSIAQAAGRCNRHGEKQYHDVYVLNPRGESLRGLRDIRDGRDVTMRLVDEGITDFLSPDTMRQYFRYMLHRRRDDLSYRIADFPTKGQSDTILNLLTENKANPGVRNVDIRASFRTAGAHFRVIEAPTQSVIVHYEESMAIVQAMLRDEDRKQYMKHVHALQQYTVNLFEHDFKWFQEERALKMIPLHDGECLYVLDDGYYSDDMGVTRAYIAQTTQFAVDEIQEGCY